MHGDERSPSEMDCDVTLTRGTHCKPKCYQLGVSLSAFALGMAARSMEQATLSIAAYTPRSPVGVRLGHSAMSAQCPVCPKADVPGLFMSTRPRGCRARSAAVVARRAARAQCRRRRLCADRRDLEGAAQYREYLQQGLGLGRRQQQHLAGPAADLPLQGHRGVVRHERACAASCHDRTHALYNERQKLHFQPEEVNAPIPASAHSTSCSSVAPATPSAPSNWPARMMGRPPGRLITGTASPTTVAVRKSLKSSENSIDSSPLGRPDVAETNAFPYDPR